MLENVNLTLKLPKAEYKRRLPVLQGRLHQLQHACRDAGLATIVVFEGWDAAGKGTAIRKLTQKLEPRAFEVHSIQAPRTTELHLPWLWRFWRRLPTWGTMGIFDRSWYGRVLIERVEKLTPKKDWRRAYREIARFERTLHDDRYQVVKFFLHIDKKEQRRRLKSAKKDPQTRWLIDQEDWARHERYDDYLAATEEMLERTETEWGPWTIVEATDGRWARAKIFETLVGRMEEALEVHHEALPDALPDRAPDETGEEDD